MNFYKKSKYGAVKVSHAGRSFGSKLEAKGYDVLWLEEKAGLISDLECQKHVYLLRNPDIVYIPDFKFTRDGVTVYREIKGFETPEWKLKKKLWAHFGPGPLEVFKGSLNNLKHVETITPKTGES